MTRTSSRRRSSPVASGSEYRQDNSYVAEHFERLERRLADMVENGSQCEQTFTFDGDTIKSDFVSVPELTPCICAICGKGCLEKGLPLCVNGNPLCG